MKVRSFHQTFPIGKMGWRCLWMFPKWLHKNKLATNVWLDICKFIRPRLHSNSKFIHPVNWKERCLLRCFLCHKKWDCLLVNLCHFRQFIDKFRQIMPTTLLLASFPGFSDLNIKYIPVSDSLHQPKNDQYRYFCYLKEFSLLFDWNSTIVMSDIFSNDCIGFIAHSFGSSNTQTHILLCCTISFLSASLFHMIKLILHRWSYPFNHSITYYIILIYI